MIRIVFREALPEQKKPLPGLLPTKGVPETPPGSSMLNKLCNVFSGWHVLAILALALMVFQQQTVIAYCMCRSRMVPGNESALYVIHAVLPAHV